MIRRTLIASIIITVIVLISLYSLLAVENRGGEEQTSGTVTIKLKGENKVYTLPVGPGSLLSYNSTLYYYLENGTIINDTVKFNITIAGYTWPVVAANYTTSSNNSGSASLLVGNIALPREMLGASRVSIPVTIPFANDALCVRLVKKGEEQVEAGGNATVAYVYEGTATLGKVNVNMTLLYDSRTGIMLKSNITIYLNNNPLFRHIQVLTEAKTAESIRVSTGSSWICDPPLSSNAMLVWEGVYRLDKGPTLKPVSINEVRAAMRGDSVIVVLSKDGRNLTNVFWQRVLSLGQQSKVPSYVIVVGGMTTDDINVFVRHILDRVGAVEPVVAIRFQDGQVAAKAYSFAKVEELASMFDP